MDDLSRLISHVKTGRAPGWTLAEPEISSAEGVQPAGDQPAASKKVAAKPKSEAAPAEKPPVASPPDELLGDADDAALVDQFAKFWEAQKANSKDEPAYSRAGGGGNPLIELGLKSLPPDAHEAWLSFVEFVKAKTESELKAGLQPSAAARERITARFPDLAEKYLSGAQNEKAPLKEAVKAAENKPAAVDAVSSGAGLPKLSQPAARWSYTTEEVLNMTDSDLTIMEMLDGMEARGIDPMARMPPPIDFENKRIISADKREQPPAEETAQSVPKGAADGVQGLEILNVDLDTILEAFKDQAKDSQIKTPPHPLVQYGMARLPIEHHQSWREFAEASALQVEQELEELVAAQLTEAQRTRFHIYFPELATRFLGEKPSAVQERRVDVLPALKQRLGHSLRAEIVGAHLIQGKHGCFLELTEERVVAGYLPDRIVKRSDLSFITDSSDQANADGLYFSPQQLMTVNVERLVDFDLWSMANCTDILTSQAAEEAQPDEEHEDEEHEDEDDEDEDDDLDLDDDDDEGEAL